MPNFIDRVSGFSCPAFAAGRGGDRILGARLLLLEDEPETLEVITRILRRIGHTVAGFANGQTIIEYSPKGESFDLLIADIGLPGEKGLQVRAKLRGCPKKLILPTAMKPDLTVV